MVFDGTEPDESYNPYFIQTEFEIIRSEIVLSNVVMALKLDEAWGKKYSGGVPFGVAKACVVIKKHLHLAPVSNTRLIAITYYSEDPVEAARIANAVADAYTDYHQKKIWEMRQAGLAVLQKEFKDEDARISAQQTQVRLLADKLGIENSMPTNRLPEQQSYWDEKQKLDQLLATRQLLDVKIKALTVDPLVISDPYIPILDVAMPPKSPTGPGHFLGIILLLAGLCLAVTGWIMVKSSVRTLA